MSSDAKIPEWAMEEAVAFEKDLPSKITGTNRVFIRAVLARALLAAERRGLEKAADHLGQMAKDTPLGHENVQRGRSTYNWPRHCEDAIRSLGDKT